MAFSYNILLKKYEELKEKNKILEKDNKKKIEKLENEIIEYCDLVQEKNKRLKEKDLIIGELLGRNG